MVHNSYALHVAISINQIDGERNTDKWFLHSSQMELFCISHDNKMCMPRQAKAVPMHINIFFATNDPEILQ